MSHHSCFLPELRPAGAAGPLFSQSGTQTLEHQSSRVDGLLVSLRRHGLCEQTVRREGLGYQTVLCGLQLPYRRTTHLPFIEPDIHCSREAADRDIVRGDICDNANGTEVTHG